MPTIPVMKLQPDGDPEEITRMLSLFQGGDAAAGERLVSLLYPSLHNLAERHMRAEREGHTLQATALLNEFFLHFARNENRVWNDRAHFLAAASKTMRRLLIDHARGKLAAKRGRGAIQISLDDAQISDPSDVEQVLKIDDLIDKLSAEDTRVALVAEYRIYGGLTYTEIGALLDVDERTVARDWKFAKAWLKSALARGANPNAT